MAQTDEFDPEPVDTSGAAQLAYPAAARPGSVTTCPISGISGLVPGLVLRGCSDPRRALQGMHRLLRVGGHLTADVPNNGSYAARRLGPAWYHCDAGNYVNFFSSRSLARFVESCGFEIVNYFYSDYTAQFRNSRLVIEQMIWDRLYANTDGRSLQVPRRRCRWELWSGLLGSMFLRPEKKYEMIGVVAKKLEVCES